MICLPYLGAAIFVSSVENGIWCRGIITKLIPIETENIKKRCPTKFSVHEVSLIQIFMVDYGNSEVLIVEGYDILKLCVLGLLRNVCDGCRVDPNE